MRNQIITRIKCNSCSKELNHFQSFVSSSLFGHIPVIKEDGKINREKIQVETGLICTKCWKEIADKNPSRKDLLKKIIDIGVKK